MARLYDLINERGSLRGKSRIRSVKSAPSTSFIAPTPVSRRLSYPRDPAGPSSALQTLKTRRVSSFSSISTSGSIHLHQGDQPSENDRRLSQPTHDVSVIRNVSSKSSSSAASTDADSSTTIVQVQVWVIPPVQSYIIPVKTYVSLCAFIIYSCFVHWLNCEFYLSLFSFPQKFATPLVLSIFTRCNPPSTPPRMQLVLHLPQCTRSFRTFKRCRKTNLKRQQFLVLLDFVLESQYHSLSIPPWLKSPSPPSSPYILVSSSCRSEASSFIDWTDLHCLEAPPHPTIHQQTTHSHSLQKMKYEERNS